MPIPTRLYHYLAQRGTRYEVLAHVHSRSSAETARSAQVPAHHLAKPVLLEDDEGCVMAVVPADCRVKVGAVARMLGRPDLHLANEARIAELFDDCDLGALPPVGMAWGVPTVVDDELERLDEVWIEGGDHERLMRLNHQTFHELMRAQPHGPICEPTRH